MSLKDQKEQRKVISSLEELKLKTGENDRPSFRAYTCGDTIKIVTPSGQRKFFPLSEVAGKDADALKELLMQNFDIELATSTQQGR